jgi:hypothetical protein
VDAGSVAVAPAATTSTHRLNATQARICKNETDELEDLLRVALSRLRAAFRNDRGIYTRSLVYRFVDVRTKRIFSKREDCSFGARVLQRAG